MTNAAARKIGTIHRGNPDFHSQTTINPASEQTPDRGAIGQDLAAVIDFGISFQGLSEDLSEMLRPIHIPDSTSTIMAPMAWCARYGPTEWQSGSGFRCCEYPRY